MFLAGIGVLCLLYCVGAGGCVSGGGDRCDGALAAAERHGPAARARYAGVCGVCGGVCVYPGALIVVLEFTAFH